MDHTLSLSPALGFITQESFEYLLVVHPSKEVFDPITNEKEIFSQQYGVSIAKKTLPHITILNCLAKEQMEETIIKRLHRIISAHHCFNVMLNNYSGFPTSQTIYVRIQDHEPFKQLAVSLKNIDEYVKSYGFPRAMLIKYPHMIIARRLHPAVYEKALKDYSRKTFNASFTVNELILLKRQNQYDKCRQVAVFKLASSFKA